VNGSRPGLVAISGRVCGPCCFSRAARGNNDGVSPQQAPVTKRIGAVVSAGDVRGFGDCGLRQRRDQAALRVTDVVR
jgi:hypothetical protein